MQITTGRDQLSLGSVAIPTFTNSPVDEPKLFNPYEDTEPVEVPSRTSSVPVG